VNIYLVRHGETEWNKEGVFRGRNDIPLNDRGRRQAERTGAFFSGTPIDAVYASPLSRAQETALPIGAATASPIIPLDGLNDMCFGPWEGLSLEEVEQAYGEDLEIWRTRPQRLRLEGAETLSRVRRRIVTDLRQIPAETRSIVLVTHRVICKVAMLHLLGMENERFWQFKCDPASITLIDTTTLPATLVFMNETCHLEEKKGAYKDF
jgi:broad specificity phosphatase PhoE